MNLGLTTTIGGRASAVPPPVSLRTTADFTLAGPTDHRAVISATAFRSARTAAGSGSLSLTGLPALVRITGTVSAWDGAALGALGVQIRIIDATTFGQIYVRNTTTGAFDTGLIAVSAGSINFANSPSGNGCRIDDFFVSAT